MKIISRNNLNYQWKENENGNITEIISNPYKWRVGDKVIVFDNSYHIDVSNGRRTDDQIFPKSTIIGGSNDDTIYRGALATIIKTNCYQILHKHFGLKVNCDLLIEYDDKQQFYINSCCVRLENEFINYNYLIEDDYL